MTPFINVSYHPVANGVRTHLSPPTSPTTAVAVLPSPPTNASYRPDNNGVRTYLPSRPTDEEKDFLGPLPPATVPLSKRRITKKGEKPRQLPHLTPERGSLRLPPLTNSLFPRGAPLSKASNIRRTNDLNSMALSAAEQVRAMADATTKMVEAIILSTPRQYIYKNSHQTKEFEKGYVCCLSPSDLLTLGKWMDPRTFHPVPNKDQLTLTYVNPRTRHERTVSILYRTDDKYGHYLIGNDHYLTTRQSEDFIRLLELVGAQNGFEEYRQNNTFYSIHPLSAENIGAASRYLFLGIEPLTHGVETSRAIFTFLRQKQQAEQTDNTRLVSIMEDPYFPRPIALIIADYCLGKFSALDIPKIPEGCCTIL